MSNLEKTISDLYEYQVEGAELSEMSKKLTELFKILIEVRTGRQIFSS